MDQSDVRLAFFDLDETITDRDTDMLWAMWRIKKNPLMGIAEILRLIFLNRAYRRGRLTGARYMRYQRFRTLFLSPERYSKLAEKFFVEYGRRHIWNEAAKIIDEYEKRGVPTVMITAQNSIIAGYFARHLEMSAVIGNSFFQEGGRFTRAIEPYAFREGKIFWAGDYAGRYNIAFSECAFYSDSINDVPLLEKVGAPVVVNPDRLLEEKARREGWKILRFVSLTRSAAI